jgi:aryl-alcohol dehydrogenase-like predicted oxidoreductase
VEIEETVREVAGRLGATPAQVALPGCTPRPSGSGWRWRPFPGTRSPARLEQNAAALQLRLVAEALALLDRSVTR